MSTFSLNDHQLGVAEVHRHTSPPSSSHGRLEELSYRRPGCLQSASRTVKARCKLRCFP